MSPVTAGPAGLTFEQAVHDVRMADAQWAVLCESLRPDDAPTAVLVVPEPESETPVPKRVLLEAIMSKTPDQSRYSAVAIARIMAPRVGCSEATARKYVGMWRRAQAA